MPLSKILRPSLDTGVPNVGFAVKKNSDVQTLSSGTYTKVTAVIQSYLILIIILQIVGLHQQLQDNIFFTQIYIIIIMQVEQQQ